MTGTNRQRLARGMRWAAQVIGLGETALLLLIAFVAWSFGQLSSSAIVIITAATIAIALVGCIISWWRERLAGILLIVASFGVLINPFSTNLDYFVFGSPLLVAGLLLLLSWGLSRKTSPSALPPSPTS